VDHIARHLHDLALIPWWGPVEERRGRLLAMLAFFRAPGYNA